MPASKANRAELPSPLKARKLLTGAGKGGGSGEGWGVLYGNLTLAQHPYRRPLKPTGLCQEVEGWPSRVLCAAQAV